MFLCLNLASSTNIWSYNIYLRDGSSVVGGGGSSSSVMTTTTTGNTIEIKYFIYLEFILDWEYQNVEILFFNSLFLSLSLSLFLHHRFFLGISTFSLSLSLCMSMFMIRNHTIKFELLRNKFSNLFAAVYNFKLWSKNAHTHTPIRSQQYAIAINKHTTK